MEQSTLIVICLIAACLSLSLAVMERLNNQPNDWFLLAVAGVLTVFTGYLIMKYIGEQKHE